MPQSNKLVDSLSEKMVSDTTAAQEATNKSEKSSEAETAVELVVDKVDSWIDGFVSMIPNMIVSIILFVVFLLLAKLVQKGVMKLIRKTSDNRVLHNLFTTIVYYLVLGLGLFIILGILKLDKAVTSLLAGVGVVGLALGFAFQDIAANFVSGIILAFRRPFEIEDIVQIKGFMGPVSRTNLRVTVVETFQGQEVYIPNKDVLQAPIINYSKLGYRRIDLEIGVSYGDDLEKVEKVVLNAIKDKEWLIRKEDLIFCYTGYGDSSINLEVKFWIKYPTEPGFLEFRSDAIKTIKKAFDENEITIPFPIRTLDFGIKGGEPISAHKISLKSMDGKDEE